MLKQRVVSALLLVLPIIAAMIFAPMSVAVLVSFALYVVAAWEWSGFVPRLESSRRMFVTVIYVAFLALAWFLTSRTDIALWVLAASIVWWLFCAFNVLRYPFSISKPFILVSGALVLVPAFVAVCWAITRDQSGFRAELLWVFLLVWAADIGAYFVGRRYGRHKLAPRVSPGKTWEGLIGGAIAAAVVSLVIAIYMDISMTPFLLLCFAVVAVSVIGDLTVSLFKRHAGVKDAGRIFPGHGGVLDRFDSFSAAAPVMLGLMEGLKSYALL